jgi:phosphopantetheinyl transferase
MLSRKIFVRYQSFENRPSALDAHPEDWLSESERRECERFRDAGRLREWLAGRFAAKQLLFEQLVPWSNDWRDVEILSRDDHGRAMRPVVRFDQSPEPWCVSISHSGRGVLVAVSLDSAIKVGVDLAEVEELNPQSLVFWFSARERGMLRENGPRHAAVCWAVKEAAYKALNAGESFVPKKFEVFPRGQGVYECHYEGQSLQDRSRITVWDVDDHVAVTAIVADSPAALNALPQIGGKLDQQPASVEREIELVGIS